VPLTTPSPQRGGWQLSTVQTLLAQSEWTAQPFVSRQAGQVRPPQSVSVSAAFFTPSAQVGTWQVPSPQTPLSQSAGAAQPTPLAHPGQTPPPQSVRASQSLSRSSSQSSAAPA